MLVVILVPTPRPGLLNHKGLLPLQLEDSHADLYLLYLFCLLRHI